MWLINKCLGEVCRRLNSSLTSRHSPPIGRDQFIEVVQVFQVLIEETLLHLA